MKTIYFLRAGASGPIKIGITGGNYQTRIANLQAGCPWPIQVLGSIPGSLCHEQWLHRRFATIRLAGEWFEPAEGLLAAVHEILSPGYCWPTTFTVAVLPDPQTKALLDCIDDFLAISDLSASAFGSKALGDPNLVRNLRAGREPRFSTFKRVREFMVSQSEAAQ